MEIRKNHLSIIAPVFNCSQVLAEYVQRTAKISASITKNYEIILIDDGSSDNSFEKLIILKNKYSKIKIIKLTKNFGQSNAILAGLVNSSGEFILVMDSDLQDKPEDIRKLYNEIMIKKMDMVLASRKSVNMSLTRNFLSRFFFFISNHFTKIKHPANTGVFRILKSDCLKDLIQHPFRPGTVFSNLLLEPINYSTINLQREKSLQRKSGYDTIKLTKFALSRLIVFSGLRIILNNKKLKEYFIPKFEIEKIIE